MKFQLIALAVLSTLILDLSVGKRIVVLYPMSSKSHFYALMPVIEELATRGHHLTVFTGYEGITKNVENVKEIVIPNAAKKLNETLYDWFALQQGGMQSMTMMSKMIAINLDICEELITLPEFKKIVAERDVDLFIADALGNEFTYPIIDKLGIPFVIHSSSGALTSTLEAMGAPIDYASVPTIFTEFDNQMTFFQRLQNVISGEMIKPLRKYMIFRKLDVILQREYPGVRPIEELEGAASLFIANTHPVTNWPRSLPPTILPIGALHARPAKPLPEKFKSFADGAKDGFFVFTLGSFVSVSMMPKEITNTFIRVFSKLPQRLIWKWESDIPENIPENIMMSDWLPQQDLLGHPNARVLITHGGMLGVQESIYHGVSLLGLPFGNDQKANVAKAVKDGWAVKLDWDNITDETLGDAIKYLINDPGVRENTVKLSKLMHDEIVPGKDLAAYWIEYILRHGSTQHLQVASKDLPFYQKHLIDVAFFLITIFLTVIYIIYIIIRTIIRCLSKKEVKRKTN